MNTNGVPAFPKRYATFRQGPVVHGPLSCQSTSESGPDSQGRRKEHQDEGEHDPSAWLSHGFHVVVLTYSGKPVYTRYGSEDLIAGFSGTLQALTSKFSSLALCGKSESLRSISVGETRIEFLDKSPLLLVCISKSRNVGSDAIRRMLSALHAQLIFILTGGVNRTLLQHTNFDVRTLLGGTRPVMDNLISWMHHDMLLSIQDSAVEALPLPFTVRSTTSSLLQEAVPACALASYLFFGHRLIGVGAHASSKNLITACDLVLLVNLVISSPSTRSGESWTPICLPSLSEDAFVYAYIRFLTDEISYVSVSLSPENSNFHSISEHAERVYSALVPSEDLDQINLWAIKCPIPAGSQLGRETNNTNQPSVEKNQALSRVRHCAIVLNQSRQIFSSKVCPGPQPEDHQRPHKTILNNYQICLSLLAPCAEGNPSQQVSITRGNDLVFVWLTTEFQFFLTAPAGCDLSLITLVYQWMRDNEKTLFLPNLESSGHSGTRLNDKAPSLWYIVCECKNSVVKY